MELLVIQTFISWLCYSKCYRIIPPPLISTGYVYTFVTAFIDLIYLCCHFAFPFQFIELKKKADAETISSEIIKAMTDDGIHDAVAKDLVSFTTDGMFHIG